jgi:hypothetical protein
MRNALSIIMKFQLAVSSIVFMTLSASASDGSAKMPPSSLPIWEQPHIRSLASSPTPHHQDAETKRYLDEQQLRQNQSNNPIYQQGAIHGGQARAEQMVEMIKNTELQRALERVTEKATDTYARDAGARGPLGVIAGAAALWMGNTVRLFKGDDLRVFTRIEGRSRSSEFSMESPLLNGRFRFSANTGFDLHMNRQISSIESQAEFNYNLREHTFSTSIRKRIAPNLDFSFGASQIPRSTLTDGNARLEYRFNF